MARVRSGPTLTGPAGEELLVSARLGWLYLEQQHLDDAERIFRAVLAWRPEDEAARRGLDACAERRRLPVPLPTAPPSPPARRIGRLRAYLEAIRRSGAPPSRR
jgi:hypothetical protein